MGDSIKYLLVLIFLTQISFKNPLQAVEIKILSYNTYLLPVLRKEHQAEYRLSMFLKEMPQLIQDYDAIVVQEVFEPEDEKRFSQVIQGLANETDPLIGSKLKTSGGVHIYSRHPLFYQKNEYFSHLIGSDFFSRKGEVVAGFKIPTINGDFPFYIVGTHTQSGENKARRIVRERNIQQIELTLDNLSAQMENQELPLGAVFVAGDLNVDFHHEERDVLKKLGTFYDMNFSLPIISAEEILPHGGMSLNKNAPPTDLPVNGPYTYDSLSNHWVPKKYQPQLLDYVLCMEDFVPSKQRIHYVRKFTVNEEPLSDHHAIGAEYVFVDGLLTQSPN